MYFDYYSASIPHPAGLCVDALSDEFGTKFLKARPHPNYKHGLESTDGNFWLYHGGSNPHPFFVSTGQDASAGADALRKIFPDHSVSRADVAHDFIAERGFDRITEKIDPIARKARVKVMFMGDPSPDQKDGRTMYYGSPDSDVRVRVYEKDKEQISKGVPAQDIPEGWTRVEVQTRPRKGRKLLVASMKEAEVFGLSKWSKQVAEEVLGQAGMVPYTPDRSMRESTADRAVRHMLDQYGNALRAFVAMHGRKALDSKISDALLDDTPLSKRRKPVMQ